MYTIIILNMKDKLLQEDNFALLQEDGSYILLNEILNITIQNALKDENRISTLLGTYDEDGTTPINIEVNDKNYNTSIIDSYSETNQDDLWNIDSSWPFLGQSFTATNEIVLNSCKFYLKKVNSPTGNATAQIYAHTGPYGKQNGSPF